MTTKARVIAYAQLGGFGARLNPLTLQPGLGAKGALSLRGRGIPPFVHNSFYAVPKPITTLFGTALSEPLLRQVVLAGVTDIRATIHHQPETVFAYYHGRGLGEVNGREVRIRKFLYEAKPLDTSGGIVRDVVSSIKEGSIHPKDHILIVGGDIRAQIDIEELVELHSQRNADVTIALAEVPREEMYRFGAAVREGDQNLSIGRIQAEDPSSSEKKTRDFEVYGNLQLNRERMALILRFYEKLPRITEGKLVDDKGNEGEILNVAAGELDIQEILSKYGPGALAPTNRQNASIVIIRAELIQELAPLVFNLSLQASAEEWRDTYEINARRDTRYKFCDLGSDWFMVFSGIKPPPEVDPLSPIAEEQRRIIERLQGGRPSVYGYLMGGYWNDDGTLTDILQAHFDILDTWSGVKSARPIPWPLDPAKIKQAGALFSCSSLGRLVEDGEVQVTGPVFIGREVVIAPGAKIGPYAVIGDGWYVAGNVSRSVLFGQKDIDRLLQGERGWRRFTVPARRTITGSIVACGFEMGAIDHQGKGASLDNIANAAVVSNGSQNVIWPIDL